MKRSLALLLVILIMASLVLTGCGGSNEPAPEPEQTSEKTEPAKTEETPSEPKKDELPKGMKKVNGIVMDEEQYLRLYNGEPESLDTTRSSISSAWIASTPLFEGLTRVEMVDGVEKIVPGMAKSWDVSEDGKVYTFHLRDAQWSDGVPVKAQDFEFAIKRVLDPVTASKYAWFLTPVFENAHAFNKGEAMAEDVGVEAIDDKTLKLTLAKPIPYFMQYTYFVTMFPVRKDMVEKYGDAYGQESEHIISNGPFLVKEWIHDNKMTFVKNDKYWDAEHVYLDKMEFYDIKEVDSRMQGLLKGDLDAARVFKNEWFQKFSMMKDDFKFISRAMPVNSWFVFNHKDRYFQNVKIRKAFFAGFDRAAVNEVIFGGLEIPAENYIPDSIMIGDENFQAKSESPKYVQKLVDSIDDPKALLIEGLKELGEDLDPAKMEVKLMPLGNTDIERKLGEFMQQEYKKNLGVEIDLDIYQHNICYKKFHEADFQMFSTGWLGDYDDPSTFIDLWHSTEGYYKDDVSYVNPEFDKCIEDAGKTLDNEERARLYKRAEELLIYEDAACAPFKIRKMNVAVKDYLNGYYQFSFCKNNFVNTYTSGRK